MQQSRETLTIGQIESTLTILDRLAFLHFQHLGTSVANTIPVKIVASGRSFSNIVEGCIASKSEILLEMNVGEMRSY